ncbi:hypothetical protein P5V15_007942 [Pogonomyrmex californicus]
MFLVAAVAAVAADVVVVGRAADPSERREERGSRREERVPQSHAVWATRNTGDREAIERGAVIKPSGAEGGEGAIPIGIAGNGFCGAQRWWLRPAASTVTTTTTITTATTTALSRLSYPVATRRAGGRGRSWIIPQE